VTELHTHRAAGRSPLARLLRVPLVAAMVLAGVTAPSVVAPRDATAYAAVYDSCTMSRCADARTARSGWAARGWPATRGWYPWSGSLSNFAGGTYHNYEGELPAGATYYEYDVYPRPHRAHRDAYRIIINPVTGATWFSPNHYTDFYRLS
jgi:hypothetical protein